MSDDRLFVSNNPIGRKWYLINIIILPIIFVFTYFAFTKYIIPNTQTGLYHLIANIIMYFFYLLYIITFFALIDRRLYDITANRDSFIYRVIYGIMCFIGIYELFITGIQFSWIKISIPIIPLLHFISRYCILGFIFITVFLGFIRGKISNQTYREYRNKIKYQ